MRQGSIGGLSLRGLCVQTASHKTRWSPTLPSVAGCLPVLWHSNLAGAQGSLCVGLERPRNKAPTHLDASSCLTWAENILPYTAKVSNHNAIQHETPLPEVVMRACCISYHMCSTFSALQGWDLLMILPATSPTQEDSCLLCQIFEIENTAVNIAYFITFFTSFFIYIFVVVTCLLVWLLSINVHLKDLAFLEL